MARKRNKEKPKEEVTKEKVEGFRGGLNVDLSRKMDKGGTLEGELAAHVFSTLQLEQDNQEVRMNDIGKWLRQYKGYRDPRNSPFKNAANTAVPITRSNVDTVYIRLEDTLYGRKRTYLIMPTQEDTVDIAREIEEAFDWYTRNVLKFKEKMQSPLLQSCKIGTGVVKIDWVDKKRTVYRYANEEEAEDTTIPKYPLPGTDTPGIKHIRTSYKGPDLFGIRREDWVMSSDAATVDEAYICGFRKYYRKTQIELKERQDLYYKKACEKLTNPDQFDRLKEDKAKLEGKELKKTKYEDPYEIWELWLKYDVDEDGEEDDIVVTFHKASRQILRCIYNPLFSGFRPFVLIKFYPTEYASDGEGICEICYKLQIEIDTLHNQRIDRMTEINTPLVFVRSGAGLDDYEINPGEVTVVDDDLEASVKIVHFPDVYHSTEREEARLIDYSNRVCGIAPENLGQTTVDRPVFKEAMARMQETNRKFQSGRDNVVRGYQRIGEIILEYFAQYQPEYTYVEETKNEKDETVFIERNVDFPLEYIWDGMKVELEASNEIANMDARREVNQIIYGMMSEWMTSNAGMVQSILDREKVPSEFKKWLSAQYEIGVKLMRRIMEDFEQADAEELALSLDKIIDVDAAIQASFDLMPEPEPEPEPEGPPTGTALIPVLNPDGTVGPQDTGGPPAQAGPPTTA